MIYAVIDRITFKDFKEDCSQIEILLTISYFIENNDVVTTNLIVAMAVLQYSYLQSLPFETTKLTKSKVKVQNSNKDLTDSVSHLKRYCYYFQTLDLEVEEGLYVLSLYNYNQDIQSKQLVLVGTATDKGSVQANTLKIYSYYNTTHQYHTLLNML